MSSPLHVQLIRNRLIRIGAIPKPKPVPIEVSNYQRQQTLALYRATLKETKKIKHDNHLRDWLSKWIRSSYRKNTEVTSEKMLRTKLRRAKRELRYLHNLNEGSLPDLERALRYAYARVGPLRHELLQRILAQPSPPTQRLIKDNPRSAPPRYPPLLMHLLTSQGASEQPTDPRKISRPPTLPARADPTSEDAHLFGPLSKRREKNIRWRYFGGLIKAVYVPLGTVSGPYEIVGIAPDTITRLERLAQGTGDDGSRLDRSVRRAYRRILGKTPIIEYDAEETSPQDSDEEPPATMPNNNDQISPTTSGRYITQLSPLALGSTGRGTDKPLHRPPTMPSTAAAWVRQAIERDVEEERQIKWKRLQRKRLLQALFGSREEAKNLNEVLAPDIE
ncbi:hypothetical protein CALCODRAFT_87392 [Calocera cornea HHB12733]|uniref:LYR motif-containing protein Cup1-like N-terminal domain-containing protein n=1 Tax=Calocera cornea HHB12733 TaxID=1353952 RepID=A0A165DD55_9BASI|nr:hypothetical protein CALCODRAFT_87392 [Calocera cornea HHB12733]